MTPVDVPMMFAVIVMLFAEIVKLFHSMMLPAFVLATYMFPEESIAIPVG